MRKSLPHKEMTPFLVPGPLDELCALRRVLGFGVCNPRIEVRDDERNHNGIDGTSHDS
jgi:hypothetical protein